MPGRAEEGNADDGLPELDVGRNDMEKGDDGGERGEQREESDADHLESAFPLRHITLYLTCPFRHLFNTRDLSPLNPLFLTLPPALTSLPTTTPVLRTVRRSQLAPAHSLRRPRRRSVSTHRRIFMMPPDDRQAPACSAVYLGDSRAPTPAVPVCTSASREGERSRFYVKARACSSSGAMMTSTRPFAYKRRREHSPRTPLA